MKKIEEKVQKVNEGEVEKKWRTIGESKKRRMSRLHRIK